ncbi:hypothetical protein K7X08_012824 [Anisodus acutangulus]|uniref:NAC domain-containing protein n=1 Tax=Anisodus acutangulus TaxID=402998 RepID=A0A9Q1M9U9_9SOLA|nr:hypothetical protein K7X08_012824 [Anisodus acutangulus]
MEGEVKKEIDLPPGFRFHPSDEELITYYLVNKISDSTNFTARAIGDVDLNKSEPWDLPGKAKMGEKEYFFSRRDRKYATGVRTNRATSTGYWKTTGKDKEIFNRRATRGEKTNWVMHEYRIHSKSYYRTYKVPSFSMGRSGDYMMNHAEIQEFNRVFRGGSSMSLPVVQSQMKYNLGGPSEGGDCFTISGLNLNLGGGATTSQPQAPPQDVSSSHDVLMMTTDQADYGAELSSGNIMNRFMAMENCADLDNYWATY